MIDPYCYPNSDILKNKMGIKDSTELDKVEVEFACNAIYELSITPLAGEYDFVHLCNFHLFIFRDLYDWAGKPRTCNIAKTNLFCLAQYIDTYAKDVFDEINKNNYYIDLNYEKKIIVLAELFADINALHPFREGNGRTQREFINALAKINGLKFDFTEVTELEMIIASSESTSGDMGKLLNMFKKLQDRFLKKNN